MNGCWNGIWLLLVPVIQGCFVAVTANCAAMNIEVVRIVFLDSAIRKMSPCVARSGVCVVMPLPMVSIIVVVPFAQPELWFQG